MSTYQQAQENFIQESKKRDDEMLRRHNVLMEFIKYPTSGEYILWWFLRIQPEKKRELYLAAGHCANTVREFMTDERSIKAVDMAIEYGNGKISHEELKKYNLDAFEVYTELPESEQILYNPNYQAALSAHWASAADVAKGVNAASLAALVYQNDLNAKCRNELKTAEICRKYLPPEMWSN